MALPTPGWVRAGLLPAALTAYTSAGQLFTDSAVVDELNPDTLNATVRTGGVAWFLNFYADWCPHCRHFQPELEGAADRLRKDSRLRFGALDCAVYYDFCSSIEVKAYPTLRVYNWPTLNESDPSKLAGADLREREINLYTEDGILEFVNETFGGTNSSGVSSPAFQASGEADSPGHGAMPPGIGRHAALLRLIDAEVALLYSLRQGCALAASESKMLREDVLEELTLWLRFLSVVLPASRFRKRLGVLVDSIEQALQENGSLEYSALVEILSGSVLNVVPPDAAVHPDRHWRICTTYTCGLWTIFHIATVASAEIDNASATVPQLQPLERIRGFVANFFGCADCVAHFLREYDACEYGRCELRRGDLRGEALWLWRMHNEVTRRVSGERGRAAPEPWPPRSACPGCWRATADGDTPWEAEALYAHLKGSYWSEEAPPPRGAGPAAGWAPWPLAAAAALPAVGLWWAAPRAPAWARGRCEDGAEMRAVLRTGALPCGLASGSSATSLLSESPAAAAG